MNNILLVLILLNIIIISGCVEKKDDVIKEPIAVSSAEPAGNNAKEGIAGSFKEKIGNRALPESEYGRKDPFAPISADVRTVTGKPPVKPALKLKLEGIIWDTLNPIAIINGRTVKQGDRIGNKTIVKIERNTVELYDGKKRTKLRL